MLTWKRVRNSTTENVEFFLFNKCLHENLSDGECIISFDPSYIPKSGKHTQGLGKFWSGCLGKVSKGLEVSSFASVGLQSKTAMHLIAKQTLVTQPDQNLVDYYVDFLKESAPKLLEVSKILVADSYFSKGKYVSIACDLGFTLVSKLPSKLKFINYVFKSNSYFMMQNSLQD